MGIVCCRRMKDSLERYLWTINFQTSFYDPSLYFHPSTILLLDERAKQVICCYIGITKQVYIYVCVDHRSKQMLGSHKTKDLHTSFGWKNLVDFVNRRRPVIYNVFWSRYQKFGKTKKLDGYVVQPAGKQSQGYIPQ